MICGAIKGPSFDLAHQQLQQALKNCHLVELRLDFFHHLDLSLLADLKNNFALPMIFTLRSKEQGGAFLGEEENRLALLKKLASLEPAYLDLEATVSPDFVEEVKRQNPNVKIIISFHDFERMPPLEPLLKEMQRHPADLYKMAVTPKSSTEALQLLDFMRSHKSVLAMGMGPFGAITRILAPIFGAAFVYASLSDGESTAPGQVLVEELVERYCIQDLSPSTSIYGLIGEPLHLSLSHISHNALMQEASLSAVYVKFPVSALELPAFIPMAKKMGLKGLSVTMPLKEAIIAHLDEIDPWAKEVGAVNTLRFEENKIHGCNTDGKGAVDAIEEKGDIAGKNLIILGAGGACKAVAAEAKARGATVTILNRDEERARNVAESLGCASGSLKEMKACDIVVNATPAAMPVDPDQLKEGTIAMDMVVQPQYTPFVREAVERGCVPVFGYEMFINQALEQFQYWFGNRIDRVKMKKCLHNAVSKNIQRS